MAVYTISITWSLIIALEGTNVGDRLSHYLFRSFLVMAVSIFIELILFMPKILRIVQDKPEVSTNDSNPTAIPFSRAQLSVASLPNNNATNVSHFTGTGSQILTGSSSAFDTKEYEMIKERLKVHLQKLGLPNEALSKSEFQVEEKDKEFKDKLISILWTFQCDIQKAIKNNSSINNGMSPIKTLSEKPDSGSRIQESNTSNKDINSNKIVSGTQDSGSNVQESNTSNDNTNGYKIVSGTQDSESNVNDKNK